MNMKVRHIFYAALALLGGTSDFASAYGYERYPLSPWGCEGSQPTGCARIACTLDVYGEYRADHLTTRIDTQDDCRNRLFSNNLKENDLSVWALGLKGRLSYG